MVNLQGNLFDAQQIFYQQLPLLKFILKGLAHNYQSRLEALGVDTGSRPLALDATGIGQLSELLTRLVGRLVTLGR